MTQHQELPVRPNRPDRLARRISGVIVSAALLGAGLATPALAAPPSCHAAVSNPVPKAPGSVTVTVHTSPRARAAFTSTPSSQPPTVTVTADGAGAAAVRYTLQSGLTGRYSVKVDVTATDGRRATCNMVFIVNGKRPTKRPSVPPPPRPRGTTAARSAAFAAASVPGLTIHYSLQCNWLYHEYHSTVINESPFYIAYYEWEWDWINGIFVDRSDQWTQLGPGGFSDRPVRHPFGGNVSMLGWFFVWDGANWIEAQTSYAGAGGDNAGVDSSGVPYCFA